MFLLVLVLISAFFVSACRSGRVTPDGETGPPWNTGGLRDYKTKSGGANAVPHATERESSWTGKGFAASTNATAARKDDEIPAPLKEDAPLSFSDCVIMAARQAPDLVDSIIDLELAEIETDTAFWRRAPSISARFRVYANLTQQHEEYSETSARLDFGIYGFEPVVSHFTHKAALLLQDIALSTHQMAVEKRGGQIGDALLRLASLERVRELQVEKAALAKQATAFQRASQGRAVDRLETARSIHQEKTIQAALDKTNASIASLLLSLKLMLGVDLDRRITVRGASAEELLRNEKASTSLEIGEWTDAWSRSLDARIAHVTLKLQDYKIMMAWAKYLPDMTMEIQLVNPTSDYAAYSSEDDVFARIYFTLPLFDWGERSRGVDSARLEKIQTAQRGKLRRLTFSRQWNEQWLNLKMARADEDLAREQVAVATLEEQKAMLEHTSGNMPFDALVDAKTKVLTEKIGLEEASLQLRLKELSSWVLSGSFQKRFFETRKSAEEAASL